MKKVDIIAALLLIIGGLNWGLIGFFDFNLLGYFIAQEWIIRVLYVLVGFSALYEILNRKSIRARWF